MHTIEKEVESLGLLANISSLGRVSSLAEGADVNKLAKPHHTPFGALYISRSTIFLGYGKIFLAWNDL